MQHTYKQNIDAFTSQKIATRSFKAFEKVLYKQAKRVHFKKFGELESVEGKSNSTGIRYRGGNVFWNGLVLRTVIKKNDEYAKSALKNKVKFVRVKREWSKDNYVYYVQLILEGVPPEKSNPSETKQTDCIGKRVGIDIGISTVAVCSENKVILTELAPNVLEISKKIRNIQRAMDRSKRAMNPLKYKEDGTIDSSNKDRWIFSKRYQKKKNQAKEWQRRNKAKRKQDHELLANEILSLSDVLFVETMSFKALQRRAKETEINKNGKCKKKKRFGKTIGHRAPSLLLQIIHRKLTYKNKRLNKVNTTRIKASQYNHITDTYEKKKLHQRWNDFGDFQIQRDLYSAFLLMNCKENGEEIEKSLCEQGFPTFKILHDVEIQRVKKMKTPPISMGV
ncbi:RNA-guided endonuclease TnpB family protein [Evansella sp. AB-rgal1]|uniref:RNA-guided endonuclease TnpB family protein n=1 Tax=Evansella sp. AB-rgal1 TaxID=3242696 RepID=UPI00359D23F0